MSWLFERVRRSQAGFTLIELMVVVVVASLLGIGILSLFDSVTKVFASENNRVLSQDGVRLAMQQMSRYIRSAASSASNTTTRSDAIALANPQELIIYEDVSGDGNTEKVRFYLAANGTDTELRLQVAPPDMTQSPPTYPAYATTGTLCKGVQNGTSAVFRYYIYNDTTKQLELTTSTTGSENLEKIVAVGITLTVNEAPRLSTSGSTLDTKVQLRQRDNGGLKN
jgi:prepilin-type N-terminal cleavage/methylation domain-containing protein